MPTNFNIMRRDTVPLTITVMNGSVPLNLTGYSVFFTLKNFKEDDDSQAVIAKKVTSHVNPAQGITAITLSAIETNVPAKAYDYDVQIVSPAPDNFVTTILNGVITVLQDVTARVS